MYSIIVKNKQESIDSIDGPIDTTALTTDYEMFRVDQRYHFSRYTRPLLDHLFNYTPENQQQTNLEVRVNSIAH